MLSPPPNGWGEAWKCFQYTSGRASRKTLEEFKGGHNYLIYLYLNYINYYLGWSGIGISGCITYTHPQEKSKAGNTSEHEMFHVKHFMLLGIINDYREADGLTD